MNFMKKPSQTYQARFTERKRRRRARTPTQRAITRSTFTVLLRNPNSEGYPKLRRCVNLLPSRRPRAYTFKRLALNV